MQKVQMDNDKFDVFINSRVRGSVLTKPIIAVQLKCEMSGMATATTIAYQVDVETYDSLRDPMVSAPRILVVVRVPNDPGAWLAQSENKLELNHCAYWVSLKNAPAISTASKVIQIPRANIFSAAALQGMMQNTADGVDL